MNAMSATDIVLDEGLVGFSYQGRTFFAHGSRVTEGHCIAYLGKDGQLTSCAGKVIGCYRITASWRTPRSFLSSHQHQVLAWVEGRRYTGRCGGPGLIFKGKRLAAEARRLAA
jgi:hypothetical protein